MIKRGPSLFALAGLAGTALVLSGAEPAAAAACTYQQLTDTTDGQSFGELGISADGTHIAFRSDGEFGDFGDNQDETNEAWLYDIATGPANVTQLTNNTAGHVFEIAMDADGDRFALQGTIDPLGENADGANQIFLLDTTAATITQVTHGTVAFGSNNASIDDAGDRVAFASSADLLSGQNSDNNTELFVYDVAADALSQETSTTDGSVGAVALSGDGGRVAFTMNSTQIGTNPQGNYELYLRNPVTDVTTQVTTTTSGETSTPVINTDGTRLGFTSDANVGGLNPNHDEAVFRHNATTAVTTLAGVSDDESETTSMNAAGTRLALDSSGDLAGPNPGSREMFFHDSQGHPGMSQITSDPVDGANEGVLDATGTHLAYISDQDPTGGNPDHNDEIFLATCGAVGPTFTDVNAANPFYDQIEWMAEEGIASGFPNGTFKPQDPVKRQQMANFLYNLAGQPAFTPPVTPTFSDYPVGSTFYAQVEWMTDEGIASGFPDGTFHPQDPVKRQQMAAFLYNLAGQPAFTPPGTPTFSDVPTSSPFYAQVEWMVAEGIASGFPNGTFKPQDPVKRQQMASFLFNFLDHGPFS